MEKELRLALREFCRGMFHDGMLPGTIVVKYYLRGFEEGWWACADEIAYIVGH